MLNKTFLCRLVIFIICFATSCHSGANHKNNNSPAKEGSAIVSTAQSSSSGTIAENIRQDTSLSVLFQSLQTTGLSDVLEKPGPFILFAPLNRAFRKLPAGTLDELVKERKDDFVNILSYHVVAGSLHRSFHDGQRLKTMVGEELVLTKRGDRLSVNGINIVVPDITANNGTIYIIDGILFPKTQNAGAY